jgi:NAD(P)-dependent dehydrogenase (short-subunit alcohol dehydrogenase family)
MRFADLLSRLLAFLLKMAFLGAVLDNAVWLITGCSTALGLALTAALFAARHHASAMSCRSENKSQQPLWTPRVMETHNRQRFLWELRSLCSIRPVRSGGGFVRLTYGRIAVTAILLSLTAISAQPAGDDIPFPSDFRSWSTVNSMIVAKDSPIFSQIGGMHIIYVNAKGFATLKQGGPLPYPDGTMFADDVHDFSVQDGSYVEGSKKAVTVMVKDAKRYPATGGWGFQVWAGGDPAKPLVPDNAHAVKACLTCHIPQKDRDYTFSTYIP